MDLTQTFNNAKTDTLPDGLRKIAFGSLLRGQIPQQLRRKDPAASPFNLAAVEALSLPDNAKAASVVRATVIAGGTPGELAPQTYGTTPAAGQIAVAPNGDIVVLAADLITSFDVLYLPERGDVFEVELTVTANVLTIPVAATTQGVVLLMEAEAMAGTSTGNKIILVPGAGAPAAGQARLNLAKTTVTFAVADAVTRARVKLLLCAAADLDTLLEQDTTLL